MRKKSNQRQTMVRVLAIFMAGLMLLSVMGALLDIF